MEAERYVQMILRDETEKFVRETPKVYKDELIEREYEFDDGAVVKYEWHDPSLGDFNHRFSIVQPPKPNPENLSTGVIRTIAY